jgi:hypothetical protein
LFLKVVQGEGVQERSLIKEVVDQNVQVQRVWGFQVVVAAAALAVLAVVPRTVASVRFVALRVVGGDGAAGRSRGSRGFGFLSGPGSFIGSAAVAGCPEVPDPVDDPADDPPAFGGVGATPAPPPPLLLLLPTLPPLSVPAL